MTQNVGTSFPHVQVPLAFIYDSRLTAEEKIVLLAIHSRCIEHEYTVVSAEHLAEDLGCCLRTMKMTLTKLRAGGWITVTRRGNGKTSRKGKRHLSNFYSSSVFRYPFFFLRHARTNEEVKTLRSEVGFKDPEGRFTRWLNGRVLEAEGDLAPEVTGKSVGVGEPEVQVLAPRVDQELEEKNKRWGRSLRSLLPHHPARLSKRHAAAHRQIRNKVRFRH